MHFILTHSLIQLHLFKGNILNKLIMWNSQFWYIWPNSLFSIAGTPLKVITQKRYRSAYAKFRCGVAPIKLETCRYELNRMPVDQRLRESCNVVEDECHVIMHCSLYVDIRTQLFTEISNISDHFPTLPTDVQFLQIMSNPLSYRSASRAMHNILSRRCSMLR